MRENLTDLLRTQGALFGRALCDILFPPRCHSCRSFVPDAGPLHLCNACLDRIAFIRSPLCLRCGIPFATEGGIDHVCSDCIAAAPPCAASRSSVVHDGPARDMIHRFKYQHDVRLRRPLGLILADHLASFQAAADAQIVVPVPLHGERLRQRGYNQAILLAEVVARQWRLPLCRDTLRRIRSTAPQTGLSAMQRLDNVRGAFAVTCSGHLAGKRVLLVDDVYTTGSTLGECARVVRAAGAAEVFAVTVSRAVHR